MEKDDAGYLGIGLALSSIARLTLTVFVVLIIVRRIIYEEEVLVAAFGQAYQRRLFEHMTFSRR